MMSELLPNWNNPILAMLLNPEALVFGLFRVLSATCFQWVASWVA
jgi:hypothetical protein